GLSQLRSAKNPNLPRPTHPVLSTPWLAAVDRCNISLFGKIIKVAKQSILQKYFNLFIKKENILSS
ncbi:hypothetical protein, partial [Piscirickettsia salmonis]|uniref:hypothetical protein n=1 Tax=Piscirickettsia salmonis TaxID=1238 RepID=UPI0018AF9F8A